MVVYLFEAILLRIVLRPFEGVLTEEAHIEHDTTRPDVCHFSIIAVLGLDNLRGCMEKWTIKSLNQHLSLPSDHTLGWTPMPMAGIRGYRQSRQICKGQTNL